VLIFGFRILLCRPSIFSNGTEMRQRYQRFWSVFFAVGISEIG
jgi:hypothetical protein